MEFRHFFINNDKMDYFYMNFLRPFGYISLLYPSEKIRLLIERSEYTYLKKYHNAYKGKRCFIVGTGPSLKKDELKMIQGEFILGVNSLCLWKDVLPFIDFFFISDVAAYKKLNLKLPNKTFVSNYCIRKLPYIDSSRFYKIPVCRYNFFSPYKKKFSMDITKCFYDFNSVVFIALQFAIYAGFKEIYLLGVDCNYNGEKMYAIDHGIRHNIQYTKDTGIKMINNFSFVKKYLLRTNIPVKIYNASSGGMLDVFPRKNLKHILYEEK